MWNEEALAYAQQLAHPGTLALALWQACVFHKLCRESQRVAKLAEAHIALAAEHGFPQALASGEFDRGWVAALAGRHDEGIAQMRRALAAGCATGAERGVSASLGDLAETLGRAGETTEALARVAASGERWYEAELHRLKGEALLRLSGSDPTEAEACFRKAIAVAQEQEANLWRLRAAMSLARLWCDHGKRAEAHNLLAPIYGWFTEGFDTSDLKETKSLLDTLA